MKKIILTLSIALTIVLHGCATPYQKSGFRGEYEETQLSENMWQVSTGLNAYSSKQRAVDFTLLRSAEICYEQGYRYFVIVNGGADESVSMGVTPSQTSGYVDEWGNVSTTTSGGIPFLISKPSATNTIYLVNDKPSSGVFYDPKFIISSIKEKYGVD